MERNKRPPDFSIFVVVSILLGIGVVMVYSSSAVKALVMHGDALHYLKRQLLWALLGFAGMVAVMRLDYWRLRPLVRPLFLITVLLLVVVLIPGIGKEINGARRWLEVGPLTMQPSELAKLSVILLLADQLARLGDQVKSFIRGLLPLLVLLGLIFALILMEPDLGTAIALAGTFVLMLYVAGARLGHLFGLGLLSVPLLVWAVWTEDYRRQRILAFLDPWADKQDTGYHIIQSLYALGSGGLFGLGLGWSRQKLFYLPEQHTDFIFAIIGEELGFIGAVSILLLFFLFMWRGYRVALSAPDLFSSLLAMGVTTLIGLQAVINIGVVTGSMPITGIPLPFVSFGGSNLVIVLAGVGFLLNISCYTRR
ncbi:MAG: stage V sporulation protein E [Bacillota bacterium]